jgi:hypothetical protein
VELDPLGELQIRCDDATAIGRSVAVRVPLQEQNLPRLGLAHEQVSGNRADRDDLVADFEIMLETTRAPELERAFAAARSETQALATDLVAEMGSSSPRDDALLLIAVVQGLALEAFSQPRRFPRAVVRRLARRFAEKLFT